MPNAFAPVVDKAELELFVGNTPPTTSEFVLINFLNAAMAQVRGALCAVCLVSGTDFTLCACVSVAVAAAAAAWRP